MTLPRIFSRSPVLFTLFAIALASAACEDEVAAPPEVFEEGRITIDASSPTAFAYLDLAGNGSLATIDDPSASTAWHLALRRFSIRLNGGVAGPGSVAGVNLAHNAGLSATEVAALTEAEGEEAFQRVTAANIPPASSFMEDGLAPDPGASWFRFDFRTQNVVANPGAAWRVRESSGRGHAVFRVAKLTMQGQRPVGATIEYRHQSTGESLGEIAAIEADLSRGPAFLSLAEGAATGPDGCGWDLAFTPDFMIRLNADCGAGTFPLEAAEDFTALARADDAPAYAGFLSVISGAFPATVNDASGFFWYNIQEGSRMWPTYNVFLVRTGDEIYKVQIAGYYDATGNSGHPTLRFQRLQ